ncbi:unnamed protein product, partial [Chrysoparadoxa australica]
MKGPLHCISHVMRAYPSPLMALLLRLPLLFKLPPLLHHSRVQLQAVLHHHLVALHRPWLAVSQGLRAWMRQPLLLALG